MSTGFFRLSAQSIVRPWAFIKGGPLIGPYRGTPTVHLVYFNIWYLIRFAARGRLLWVGVYLVHFLFF